MTLRPYCQKFIPGSHRGIKNRHFWKRRSNLKARGAFSACSFKLVRCLRFRGVLWTDWYDETRTIESHFNVWCHGTLDLNFQAPSSPRLRKEYQRRTPLIHTRKRKVEMESERESRQMKPVPFYRKGRRRKHTHSTCAHCTTRSHHFFNPQQDTTNTPRRLSSPPSLRRPPTLPPTLRRVCWLQLHHHCT